MEAQAKTGPDRRGRQIASRLLQLSLAVAIVALYLLVLSRGHLPGQLTDLLP